MDFSVTYNSYVIGGASTVNRAIGALSWAEGNADLAFSVDFVLFGSSVSDYATKEAAMIAALGTPESSFSVANGATTIFSGVPGSFTAFNVIPRVERVEDERYDTATSAHWRLTVTCGRPPKRAGDLALLDYSVQVSWTASRLRMITITGTYSASGGAGARARHTSNFSSLATSVMSSFDGLSNYYLVSEGPVAEDWRNSVCTFTAVYREKEYATGETGVTNEDIKFERSRAVTDTPTRTSIRCVYTADVDASSVAHTGLEATLDSVRSTLVAKAVALYASGGVGYIENYTDDIDTSNNRINGVYQIVVAGSGFDRRRSAGIQVNYDASRRRTVLIYGTYQLTEGGNTAIENHDAGIAAFVSAELDLVDDSVTWELISEGPMQYGDDKENATFTRVYREQLWTTGANNVVNESVQFARIGSWFNGEQGEIAPVRVEVTYVGFFDQSQGLTLYDEWATIYSALKAKASQLWQASNVVAESSTPVIDPTNSVIQATMTLWLIDAGSDVMSYSYSVALDDMLSWRWRKVHNGNPLSFRRFLDSRMTNMVVTESIRRVGRFDNPYAAFGVLSKPRFKPSDAGDAQWYLIGVPRATGSHVVVGSNPEDLIGETVFVGSRSSAWKLAKLESEVTAVGPAGQIGVPSGFTVN